MDKIATIITLSPPEFAAVVALFLPGFVSLKIHGFIRPWVQLAAAEMIIDAFGYSLLNAGVFSWAIFGASRELAEPLPDYRWVAFFAVLICLVGPVIWPILLRLVQRYVLRGGWLLGEQPTAFDAFFSTDNPCWIMVHLADGSRVGGWYGPNSYASAHPYSGDFYIEQLWSITPDGKFDAPIDNSKGALFRQSDYVWLELFWDNEVPDEAGDGEPN